MCPRASRDAAIFTVGNFFAEILLAGAAGLFKLFDNACKADGDATIGYQFDVTTATLTDP